MKTTHLVEAWNTYKTDRTGKYIAYKYVIVDNHTEAIDIIHKQANDWNKLYKDQPNLQINFLTCNGHIRTI